MMDLESFRNFFPRKELPNSDVKSSRSFPTLICCGLAKVVLSRSHETIGNAVEYNRLRRIGFIKFRYLSLIHSSSLTVLNVFISAFRVIKGCSGVAVSPNFDITPRVPVFPENKTRLRPNGVMTISPALILSIGLSPKRVATIVPATKHWSSWAPAGKLSNSASKAPIQGVFFGSGRYTLPA